MNNRENEFRKRLLSTFKIEAHDHLKTISSGLVRLEKAAGDAYARIIESVYRASHNLKGAARAVNMTEIEVVCQSLEGVFAAMKRSETHRSPELFDTLYQSLEAVRALLACIEDAGMSIDRSRIYDLVQRLSNFEHGDVIVKGGAAKEGPASMEEPRPGAEPAAPEAVCAGAAAPEALRQALESPALTDTVRVSADRLGSLLIQAEEMLSIKLASSQHAANILEIRSMLDSLKRHMARALADAAPAGGRERTEARLQDFLDRTGAQSIKAIEGRLAALSRAASQYGRSVDRMVDALLDDMKKAAMLPFSSLLELFPLLARNISREQGKEVELVIRGESIEADRRILEGLKDPLIHLVRNCIDHGIESPRAREAAGKPRRGAMTIAVTQLNGNRVEILVSDDGAGIDISRVREAAVRNGTVSREEADGLGKEGALSLIFHSGVSTSPIITDMSGRGLGLAIAREKTERLGGTISVQTRARAGTAFRILIPLTVATFRAVIVRSADQVFAVPTTNIERTVRVKNEGIRTVENREAVTLDGAAVSFVWLHAVLSIKNAKKPLCGGFTPVLVLNLADRRIAFGVDEIVNEQEVLIKGLGRQLSRVRNIAGAAILGSGKPVPVLNASDLLKSAVRASGPPVPAVAAQEPEAERKKVLVVEDSITSRILLKNILESAGYEVKTAVDGIDALTTLKTGDFDLVVSDIEMPRMGGFDLTARIRGDKRLSELPVVLVTALEAREDRERGIEAGANAYIVKSSFDQSNLLEVIGRLI